MAALLHQMSLEEKVHLLTGETAFTLPGNDSIGLAPLAFSDGPTGVRGLKFIGGEPVALFPNATLIAASWDDSIAEQVGHMLAEEAQRQHIHVVLGPTINLHRSPLGGRLFEAYSEDPYLTGRTAVGYVKAMQRAGTAACLKHLVANESETLRNFMDSRLSESTLRELYLLPFEMAVQDADVWSMMAGYNDINGTPATEQDHIQNGIVKGEWGWDGLIMSDWFATKKTVESANGGLDLVMPGPGGPWSERLVAAVRAGQVDEATVDDHVRRLLLLAERTGGLATEGGMPREWPEDLPAVDSPVRKEQLLHIAARGMTVVTNSGVLPLPESGTIALIGRHALATINMGGGSAQVNPPYQITVENGMTARFGDRLATTDGVWVRDQPLAAEPAFITDPTTGAPGMEVALFAEDGTELDRRHEDSSSITVGWDDGLAQQPVTAVLTARLNNAAGPIMVGAIGAGHWNVATGGQVLTADLELLGKDPGEAMLRPPAFTDVIELPEESIVTATITLPANTWREQLLADAALKLSEESHLLTVGGMGKVALVANPAPASDDDQLKRAEDAARAAEVAVVVVGLTEEQETEAADKQTLTLPGRQDELVRRVAAAASRTVVVVNAATPILMPWIDDVDAVVIAGLPGQEGGHAVAAVLAGDLEPTGRLVCSYPSADAAAPAWEVVPDANLHLSYSEGTAIGYRGFHSGNATPPLFWFGHGLGYGQWQYGPVQVRQDAGEGLQVAVELTNVSGRDSRETVQVYLDPLEQDQPVRLVGYQGVDVPAGATVTVHVACDDRLRRRWDEGSAQWVRLAEGGELLIARGLGDIRARISLDRM